MPLRVSHHSVEFDVEHDLESLISGQPDMYTVKSFFSFLVLLAYTRYGGFAIMRYTNLPL